MPGLDRIEGPLRAGVARLGRPFIAAQVAWLEARQARGGGFSGRAGPPDAYYTDFALRALDLVAPDSPAFAAAAPFVRRQPPPVDLVGAFSRLSCERILLRRGLGAGSPTCDEQRESGAHASRAGSPIYDASAHGDETPGARLLDHEALRAVVERQALPGGGFAVRPGSTELSAYRSLLGALGLQMLGLEPMPAAGPLRSLRRDSGGFAERPGELRAQTSATAAVLAVLALEGALTVEEADGAARFLATMQGADGGLRAHATAPAGDLLSTCTGLLTVGAAAVETLDLPALGRFARSVARSGGGFGATPSDPGADVEYTWYGLATLALLYAAAGG